MENEKKVEVEMSFLMKIAHQLDQQRKDLDLLRNELQALKTPKTNPITAQIEKGLNYSATFDDVLPENHIKTQTEFFNDLKFLLDKYKLKMLKVNFIK